MTRRRLALLAQAFLLAACAGGSSPPSGTAKPPQHGTPPTPPAAVSSPGPLAMVPPPPGGSIPPEGPSAPPPLVAGALYSCVRTAQGMASAQAIAFEPAVESLCRRHPEMGPCQYERENCRRSGGRVYTAEGREVTRQVEDEYDRRVLRVRLPSD